jgi:hypothetical protein
MNIIFCVCFDVMFSGEYNGFFYVTLSVYRHLAG